MILCWSAKGGSGTTVVAVSLALALAQRTPQSSPPHHRVPVALPTRPRMPPADIAVADTTPPTRPARWPHLVDLAGDVPLVLGAPTSDDAGVFDWIASPLGTPESLELLVHRTGRDLRYLPSGHQRPTDDDGWQRLATAIGRSPAVVDCGLGTPPVPLLHAARASLLVIRPCYLALRRATSMAHAATGVVLVREPGRALGPEQVKRALGVPVVATVELDPTVARAVDAGILTARLPRSLSRQLARVVEVAS